MEIKASYFTALFALVYFGVGMFIIYFFRKRYSGRFGGQGYKFPAIIYFISIPIIITIGTDFFSNYDAAAIYDFTPSLDLQFTIGIFMFAVIPTLIYLGVGIYILSLEHLKGKKGYKGPAIIYFISVPTLIIIIITIHFVMNYSTGRFEATNKPTGYGLYRFLVLKNIIPRSGTSLDEETTQTARVTETEPTKTIKKVEDKEIKKLVSYNLEIPKFDVEITTDLTSPNRKKISFESSDFLRSKTNLVSDATVYYHKQKFPIGIVHTSTFTITNNSGITSTIILKQFEEFPQYYQLSIRLLGAELSYLKQNYVLAADGNFYDAILEYGIHNENDDILLTWENNIGKKEKAYFVIRDNASYSDSYYAVSNMAVESNFFKKDIDINNWIYNKAFPASNFLLSAKLDSNFEPEGDCKKNNLSTLIHNNYETWTCKDLIKEYKEYTNHFSLNPIEDWEGVNHKSMISFYEKIFFKKIYSEYLSALKKENLENTDIVNIKTDEKYYALIIGNNNYQHLEKLDAAENDARVLANILKKKYGFEVELLLNGDYDNTVNSIFKMTKKLKKDDNLLIYYAGHGQLDRAENRGYWLPIDASYELRSRWISNSTIVDRVKATKAKHVLLMVDSCFSGLLMRSGEAAPSVETMDAKYIERLKNKKTRLVITSGGNEPVVDSDGGQHSLFALKLIDTLKNNNTVINSQILFENIRRYVVSNADQTPERAMVHKTGHDGGDFLFFAKN